MNKYGTIFNTPVNIDNTQMYYQKLCIERTRVKFGNALANRRVPNMSSSEINRAINKVSQFIALLNGKLLIEDCDVDFDNSLENNIIIKLNRHQDIQINLNYGFDVEDDIYEEAYLQYSRDGRLFLDNGTMNDIASLIEEILHL